MEQPVPVVGLGIRNAAGQDRAEPLFLGLLLLTIATAWPIYVFDGSQIAYVSAAAASAGLAAKLAAARSQALLLLLVAEVGLLGTEANSALGSGRPLLGTLRLIDITIASSVLTLGVKGLKSSAQRHSVDAGYCTRPINAIGSWIRVRAMESLVIVLVVGWVVALWFAHGHLLDGITKTDVRVAGLAVATCVLARVCTVEQLVSLPSGIAALGPALSAKALAIYASTLWVVGTGDRLQASMSEANGQTRVILIGGDTILIFIPAITALALSTTESKVGRWFLWFCGLSSIAGLLVSGTRSGLIVSALALALSLLLRRGLRFHRPSLRVSAATVLVAAITVGGLVVTGTATRFTTPDAPHVGANFRVDELHAFFRLPSKDIFLGQGIGGRFVSKDINGEPVVTGWSHMLPVWLLLKAGILGIAATGLGIFYILRRGINYREGRPLTPNSALGLVLFVGLILMSLTIDRVTLPEGGVLLGLSIGLLGGTTA